MGRTGVRAFIALSIISFALVLAGSLIDQFRFHEIDIFGNTECVTLWGLKEKCYSTQIDLSIGEFSDCDTFAKHFQVAKVAAVISVALILAAAVSAMISCCCCSCLSCFALVLMLLATITVGAVWGIMLNLYLRNVGECSIGPLKEVMKLSVGFMLNAAGWGFIVLSVVLWAAL